MVANVPLNYINNNRLVFIYLLYDKIQGTNIFHTSPSSAYLLQLCHSTDLKTIFNVQIEEIDNSKNWQMSLIELILQN